MIRRFVRGLSQIRDCRAAVGAMLGPVGEPRAFFACRLSATARFCKVFDMLSQLKVLAGPLRPRGREAAGLHFWNRHRGYVKTWIRSGYALREIFSLQSSHLGYTLPSSLGSRECEVLAAIGLQAVGCDFLVCASNLRHLGSRGS